jgi:hypothetical protein
MLNLRKYLIIAVTLLTIACLVPIQQVTALTLDQQFPELRFVSPSQSPSPPALGTYKLLKKVYYGVDPISHYTMRDCELLFSDEHRIYDTYHYTGYPSGS